VIAQATYSSSGDAGAIVIGLIVWFGLASIPAAIAHNRGHNAFAFFLFGLLLFIPALAVVLTLPPKSSAGMDFQSPLPGRHDVWQDSRDGMFRCRDCSYTTRHLGDAKYHRRLPLSESGRRVIGSAANPTTPPKPGPHFVDKLPDRNVWVCRTCGETTTDLLKAMYHWRGQIPPEAAHNITQRPDTKHWVCATCGFGTPNQTDALQHWVSAPWADTRPKTATPAEIGNRSATAVTSWATPQAGTAAVRPAWPQTDGVKMCPDCAEEVRAAARKCRFCGYRFVDAPVSN
jgi:hypothetical protein